MAAAKEVRRAELAIIISYPTSASRVIVLLKTPTKYREFFPTLFVKATDFQLVFNFEQTCTITIFGEHGIMAHIPWWLKPNGALEFLIIGRYPTFVTFFFNSIFIQGHPI